MEMLKDISLLWSFLHAMLLFMLLHESRLKGRKNTAVTLAVMGPLCILNIFLFMMLGSEIMTDLVLFTLILPGLIFFFLIDRYRGARFLFTFCAVDTVCVEIILVTGLIDNWLGGGYVFLTVSRFVIFPLMEVLLWKCVHEPYRDLQRKSERGWSMPALISVLYYLLLIVVVSESVDIIQRAEDHPAVLISFVIIPLSYAAFYRAMRTQQELHEAKEQHINMDRQATLLKHELSVEREYIALARRHRHDIRHGIRLTQEYLNKENYEGAKAYLAEYEQALAEASLKSYCANEMVNALLRICERRCRQAGVRFSVKAAVPDVLPYTSVESSTLFGNLLENACEAAEKCSGGSVELTAECRHGSLCMQIRNSVGVQVEFAEGVPVSTKGGVGGIGVSSVMEILSRHGGMIQMEQKGDLFVTRVIQPL